MIDFILNNEPAYFPDKLEEISSFTMNAVRKARPKGEESKMRYSELSEILLLMGIWTDKQRYALSHSTHIVKLVESPVFFLMNSLLLGEPKINPSNTIAGQRLNGFEKTPLGDALEFYYRSQTDQIENRMYLIAKQMEGDQGMKSKYAQVAMLPFTEVDAAYMYLIEDFNYTSLLGSRTELQEPDKYTQENKPSKRLKIIYDSLGWDLIIEQLPNFALCKNMSEGQIKEIPYGQILDELVKIKKMNLANWIQYKDHERKMEEERQKREKVRR